MGEEGVDIDTSANTGDHGAENHIDISVKLEDDGRELDLKSSLDDDQEEVVATLKDIDHGTNATKKMKIEMEEDSSDSDGDLQGEGSMHIDNP